MSSHYFEFSAPSVLEAVEQAERELQISREDFHYSVVESFEDQSVLVRVFLGGAKQPNSINFQSVTYKPWGEASLESPDTQVLLSFIQEMLTYFEMISDGFFIRQDSPTEFYLDIQCHDPGILIGKGGVALDALRAVSSTYLARQHKEHNLPEPRKIFQIDIQGYFRKRLENLERDVDRAVSRSKKTGKDVLLKGEYPPGERRHIHIYAQKVPGIITESQGEGFYKSVLISFRENGGAE